MSYRIGTEDGHRYILCVRCGAKSFHPSDIDNRWCGRCRQFHDYLSAVEAMEAEPALIDAGRLQAGFSAMAEAARAMGLSIRGVTDHGHDEVRYVSMDVLVETNGGRHAIARQELGPMKDLFGTLINRQTGCIHGVERGLVFCTGNDLRSASPPRYLFDRGGWFAERYRELLARFYPLPVALCAHCRDRGADVEREEVPHPSEEPCG